MGYTGSLADGGRCRKDGAAIRFRLIAPGLPTHLCVPELSRKRHPRVVADVFEYELSGGRLLVARADGTRPHASSSTKAEVGHSLTSTASGSRVANVAAILMAVRSLVDHARSALYRHARLIRAVVANSPTVQPRETIAERRRTGSNRPDAGSQKAGRNCTTPTPSVGHLLPCRCCAIRGACPAPRGVLPDPSGWSCFMSLVFEDGGVEHGGEAAGHPAEAIGATFHGAATRRSVAEARALTLLARGVTK